MTEPFLLRKRFLLPRDSGPQPHHIYDTDRQIWIDAASGLPLVRVMSARTTQSAFGETRLTEAREGVDPPRAVAASQFGETLLTKTVEGHDQSELASGLQEEHEPSQQSASLFGETTITRSSEGQDRVALASDFGETARTFTQEGVDATEVAADIYAVNHHV